LLINIAFFKFAGDGVAAESDDNGFAVHIRVT
jgi:hypothetical protein